ncbi:helix-turn-helix domain-containing protein [Actinoplanes sp. Pm04-4]|uniref:Helix-turn-helix domain-containing protein n=1 Tax=Paractinoplanes pyxinae TaxID=2997416 RepID=A0ABT4BFG4_9ACTN|nr:helix-turn-helix domain-containing protein [Actinoplanes pyxinae]MCY1145264.1 helix-turn-helix domain-containing protein [Actinoplanes pyxinae]
MTQPTGSTPTHPLAAIRELVRDTQDLSANERLVLIVIASHSNSEGDAWPSAQKIADTVGCSLRTVQRAVSRLLEIGRLAVRRVAGIASNVYRVLTSAPPATTSPEIPATTNGAAVTTAKVSPEVVKGSEDVKGWRRFLPSGTKAKTTGAPKSGYPYPEKRGAALPPEKGSQRCSRHVGQLAHNCAPCRSEALGGVA